MILYHVRVTQERDGGGLDNFLYVFSSKSVAMHHAASAMDLDSSRDVTFKKVEWTALLCVETAKDPWSPQYSIRDLVKIGELSTCKGETKFRCYADPDHMEEAVEIYRIMKEDNEKAIGAYYSQKHV